MDGAAGNIQLVLRLARPGVGCVMPVSARRMPRICAANRIEGRDDVRHLRPQPKEHRPDDVIAEDQDLRAADVCRQMTVSKMPRKFQQVQRVTGGYGIQRLISGGDRDVTSTFEKKRIATAQGDGFGKIDQQPLPAGENDAAATQVPGLVIEHRLSTLVRRPHICRCAHANRLHIAGHFRTQL